MVQCLVYLPSVILYQKLPTFKNRNLNHQNTHRQIHGQNIVACVWDFDKTLIPWVYANSPIRALWNRRSIVLERGKPATRFVFGKRLEGFIRYHLPQPPPQLCKEWPDERTHQSKAHGARLGTRAISRSPKFLCRTFGNSPPRRV